MSAIIAQLKTAYQAHQAVQLWLRVDPDTPLDSAAFRGRLLAVDDVTVEVLNEADEVYRVYHRDIERVTTLE
ncbi:hypothetical protein AYR62_05730 [Secundilactobacillus paracollinoides]|uniref:hypothetical protein n=1 Tax=Secundilactobacillus paracollinoides TaxID=240427 RepID=UPI00081A4DF7|nr:hypothetical protein [Secundilactobacillus paracollinoides]ANZ63640.1 hypothetical protein AYR62_05730 [Secundilactobacillus paracollinoides]